MQEDYDLRVMDVTQYTLFRLYVSMGTQKKDFTLEATPCIFLQANDGNRLSIN